MYSLQFTVLTVQLCSKTLYFIPLHVTQLQLQVIVCIEVICICLTSVCNLAFVHALLCVFNPDKLAETP